MIVPLILSASVLAFAVFLYRREVIYARTIHNYKQQKKKYHA